MPVAGGEKFSRNREAALAALLRTGSVSAAAKETKIGETTLWRWLQDPDFQREYKQARKVAMETAIQSLQAGAAEAVQCLRDIMADEEASASAKVSAAKTVLETAIKLTELEELSERVAAIEKAVLPESNRRGA